MGINLDWLVFGKGFKYTKDINEGKNTESQNDRHVGRFEDVYSLQLPENIDSDLNKTADMSAVTPVCYRRENLRHVAGLKENESAQTIENEDTGLKKTCDMSQLFEFQERLLKAIDEKSQLQDRLISLTEQNASLRLEVLDREQRIRELEREIELLRREIALARSRAAGEETG